MRKGQSAVLQHALTIPVLLAGFAWQAPARAEDEDERPLSPAEAAELRELAAPSRGFPRVSGAIEFGDGLRFNNPYRLSTELGSTAESLSRTSSYLDLAAGLTYGPAIGLAQGLSIHLSLGVEGVKQQVVTPSYEAALRTRNSRFLAYGRLGTPIILSPDSGLGFELAAGGAYFLTSRVGVGAEIIGDLFYGAGSPARTVTTYPILSAQLGLVFEQELLP